MLGIQPGSVEAAHSVGKLIGLLKQAADPQSLGKLFGLLKHAVGVWKVEADSLTSQGSAVAAGGQRRSSMTGTAEAAASACHGSAKHNIEDLCWGKAL
jgi:hypothetical protein